MKNTSFFLFLILLAVGSIAQERILPELYIDRYTTLHFLSPEPVQYVDLSTNAIAGDLPLKNVVRLKIQPDSIRNSNSIRNSIVTIVGESFMAQYRLCLPPTGAQRIGSSQIEILPEHMVPLNVPGFSLSSSALKKIAFNLMVKTTSKPIVKGAGYNLIGKVNAIYCLGDYIFLDVAYNNDSNIRFEIDQIRFKIEDKKVTRATNVQAVEITPELVLMETPSFKHHYRNIFVFRKFTYPGNKSLVVTITEKQVSGRSLDLKIKYQDVLDADMVDSNLR